MGIFGRVMFTVLFRQLRRSRRQYMDELGITDKAEQRRQGNVFAQAWLFSIAKTVAEFSTDSRNDEAIEAYVKDQYGEPVDFERDPADPESKDYDVILSGMRAAKTVQLLRPMNASSVNKQFIGECAWYYCYISNAYFRQKPVIWVVQQSVV